jgi:hypothetical protein
MSKGSRSRVTDVETYRRNFDRIFKRAKAIERKRSGNQSGKEIAFPDGSGCQKQRKALVSATKNGKPPNPGSPEAIALGCKCPVLDNHNGTGSDYGPGTFWYTDGCPVHSVPQWEALKKAVGANQSTAKSKKIAVNGLHGKAPKSAGKRFARKPNTTRGFYRIRKD